MEKYEIFYRFWCSWTSCSTSLERYLYVLYSTNPIYFFFKAVSFKTDAILNKATFITYKSWNIFILVWTQSYKTDIEILLSKKWWRQELETLTLGSIGVFSNIYTYITRIHFKRNLCFGFMKLIMILRKTALSKEIILVFVSFCDTSVIKSG